jgi:hypothetical protein
MDKRADRTFDFLENKLKHVEIKLSTLRPWSSAADSLAAAFTAE